MAPVDEGFLVLGVALATGVGDFVSSAGDLVDGLDGCADGCDLGGCDV